MYQISTIFGVFLYSQMNFENMLQEFINSLDTCNYIFLFINKTLRGKIIEEIKSKSNTSIEASKSKNCYCYSTAKN